MSHRITVPNTLSNFNNQSYMDYRLGGFHVEYYPIELQMHSVMLSYAWDEGTKTLELGCSKSMKPFEDKENGLEIVFSEVSHPYTRFEVDLIARCGVLADGRLTHRRMRHMDT